MQFQLKLLKYYFWKKLPLPLTSLVIWVFLSKFLQTYTNSAEVNDDESITDCEKVLRGLETIDDELNDIGIAFVQTENEDYPYNKHAIEAFPAVGLYRNGDFIQYPGDDLKDEEEIRKWFMDEDTLLIPGEITVMFKWYWASKMDLSRGFDRY